MAPVQSENLGPIGQVQSNQPVLAVEEGGSPSSIPRQDDVQNSMIQRQPNLRTNPLTPVSTQSELNTRFPLAASTTLKKRPIPQTFASDKMSRKARKLSKVPDVQKKNRQERILMKLTPNKRTLTRKAASTRLQAVSSASVTIARTLNIELVTKGSLAHKVVCVDTETSVEALIVALQQRMDRILGNQRTYALQLSLAKPDSYWYVIESDDPDTWKMFLRRIGDPEKEDIDVIAAVCTDEDGSGWDLEELTQISNDFRLLSR